MFRRKAVLVIHGFAGTPFDLEYLSNYLELERKFDVFAYTLPGHESLSKRKVTANDWINSCEDHIEMLIKNGYKKIYVVGHSMGGVITCHLATKYKQIKKIVLLAPAFRYFDLKDSNFNLLTVLKQTPEVIKHYDKNEVLARVFKLPLLSFKEFIALVKKYYNTPKKVTCKALIIQGLSDSVVPIDSSKYVYESLKSKKKKILFYENTEHEIFRSDKKDEINNEIRKFLKHS